MKKDQSSRQHYPEIDMVRGLAVMAMIIFHTAFQLRYIFHKRIIANDWFWMVGPLVIGGTFLTVAGISLYIGAQKGRYNTISQLLKRNGRIFGLGMLLTLITCMAHEYAGGYVYFGILHCIGLAALITYYTLGWPKYANMLAGILLIGVGMYVKSLYLTCKCAALFWLYPCHATSLGNQLDYYPLIPSIGYLWVGIFLGKILYPPGQRAFNLNPSSTFITYSSPIRFLGRHSLLIYCIHAPIIFSIIYLMDSL